MDTKTTRRRKERAAERAAQGVLGGMTGTSERIGRTMGRSGSDVRHARRDPTRLPPELLTVFQIAMGLRGEGCSIRPLILHLEAAAHQSRYAEADPDDLIAFGFRLLALKDQADQNERAAARARQDHSRAIRSQALSGWRLADVEDELEDAFGVDLLVENGRDS